MDILNTWQFNLIGYLISVVIFFQCFKLAVKNAKHDGAAAVLLQFIAGGTLLILSVLFEYKLPTNKLTWLLLVGACIFYAIADRISTTVRKHLQISLYTIINQLNTVFIIIYGFIIFREPVILSKVIGAALIIGGNVLVLYKKGGFRFNKYILLAIIATFCTATAISIDIGTSSQFNLAIYCAITFLLPATMIAVSERIHVSTIIHEYKAANEATKYYFITGISWAFVILFLLRAFQFGEVSTVNSLAATSVLFNVLVAYFFMNERTDEVKKIAAAILVIDGVYLTVL